MQIYPRSFLPLILTLMLLLCACANSGSDSDSGDSNPPVAPSVTNITSSAGQLSVTWGAVKDATAYEVWYHTTHDSVAAKQSSGDITATTLTLPGLTNFTTYYVWVKAKNRAGTSGFSNMANATPAGVLLFSAERPAEGRELWMTDGTAGNTTLVKDIYPGVNSDSIPNASEPRNFTPLNGRVVFTVRDADGYQIWATDGTPEGTSMVKDLSSGEGDDSPAFYALLKGKLYFNGCGGMLSGSELWETDGTPEGTKLVKEINQLEYEGSNPHGFTLLNDTLVFSASDGISGLELWITDGSEAGTKLVKDINPGSGFSFPREFTLFNDKLYFTATDDTHGTEVWVTDGTASGTKMVKDIYPGIQLDKRGVPEIGDKEKLSINGPFGYTQLNKKLYFVADDNVSGAELWVTDGTETETKLVKDICPGIDGSRPSELRVLNGKLYFAADDGATGIGLWESDGTEAGTKLVKNFPRDFDNRLNGLTPFNQKLYFTANDGVSGNELWVSDGTTEGTIQVMDINPEAGNGNPAMFTPFNGKLYFAADNGFAGVELWVTDGTTAGTIQLKDINLDPIPANSSSYPFTTSRKKQKLPLPPPN